MSPVKLGGTQTYHSDTGLAVCRVSVGSRNGKSVMKVDSNAAGAWALAGFGWFLGTLALLLSAAFTKNPIFYLLLLGLYGGGFYGVKSLIRRWNEKVRDKVNEAASNLAKAAENKKAQAAEVNTHSPRAIMEADQDVQQTSL
jgi:hypothetical protein